MDRTRLQAICDPARATYARPFVVEADDRAWTCATDGHVMAAVRGKLDGVDTDGGLHIADGAAQLVKDAGRARGAPIAFDVLRDWAGPAPDRSKIPCTKCKGKGTKPCSECRGIGKVKCDECKDGKIKGRYGKLIQCHTCYGKATRRCPDCKGKKMQNCALCDGEKRIEPTIKSRPGRVARHYFDRNLAAQVLTVVDPAEVTIHVTGMVLVIAACGWRCFVAGYHYDAAKDDPAVELPLGEIPPAEETARL